MYGLWQTAKRALRGGAALLLAVQLLIAPTAAARAADELSIAAVTRGIERPGRRSCLVEIRMRGADWGAVGVFAGFLVFTMLAKGAG